MNLTLENETACDCQGEWIVLENAINGIIVPVFAILGLGGNIVVILAYRWICNVILVMISKDILYNSASFGFKP